MTLWGGGGSSYELYLKAVVVKGDCPEVFAGTTDICCDQLSQGLLDLWIGLMGFWGDEGSGVAG